jgi:hypothetical protein
MTGAMAARARRVVGDAVGDARAAVVAGAVPVDQLAAFARVRADVDEGWRAYLRVAIDVAAQRLVVARTAAEPLVALPGGAEVYADAALRLAAVLGTLGRKQEAHAVMALALALDPERPITLAEFSPDVVELVDAVRATPPVLAKLTVTTSPAGAQVRVDGRDVGRAPVTLDVARGQHIVVAKLPDHRPAVQGVAVDGAQSVALALEDDPEVTQLAAGAALGLSGPAQQRLVEGVLRFGDFDEVVVVAQTSRRGGPTLIAQRCAGTPVRCSAVVEIGYADASGLAAAARSAWDAVRAGELRYPPTVLGERGGAVVTHRWCELCRKPWFWGSAAAVAVAGVVVTIVATSGSKPNPLVGLNPNDFLPK